MTKQNRNDTRIVFKMVYAGELMNMGHTLLGTMPNPQKPEFKMFIFQADPTFDEDLKELQERDRYDY